MDELRASVDDLARRLRPHYARFLAGRDEQCVLTAHSHQAWPDASRAGQIACWDDAARYIDDKWGKVFEEVVPEFQLQVAMRLGSKRPSDLALAPNTHELVYRLASCFPADAKVVTTDSEFHSLRRQLTRLEEDGLQVTRVPVEPDPDTFCERFADALSEHRPQWAALSAVFFTTSRVVKDLQGILTRAAELGIPVLVDAYHAYNVLPLDVDTWPGTVFVTGGGYKYAQTGEGACWMLLPKDAEAFRPRTTGWFSDFEHLEAVQGQVSYGQGGFRFFGATFDPSGIYRGVWTTRWLEQMKLDVRALRAQSLLATTLTIARYHQLELVKRGLVLATPERPEERGGFISFRTPKAGALADRLRQAGVHTDHRGDLLRLGPGPYTLAREIDQGMETLAALV
ncbi:MAG: aminotransferase class V-fold PLP-dependent enzyme [Deltaproteobacteria bacterium]|nr:aminotransferase class V-fold PLP-dependent enzyme [Deltaproteobacteria bacterium]